MAIAEAEFVPDPGDPQWATYAARCPYCRTEHIHTAPVRFLLELLPVQCPDCKCLTAYPVGSGDFLTGVGDEN